MVGISDIFSCLVASGLDGLDRAMVKWFQGRASNDLDEMAIASVE
jgi:hypothetical protein